METESNRKGTEMKIQKSRKAETHYVDRGAERRKSAEYEVVDEDGNALANIRRDGESSYMSTPPWKIRTYEVDGTPRYVGYKHYLKDAKAEALRLVKKVYEEACQCMVETDPTTGEERVMTHSSNCPDHPEYEPSNGS